jgi:hypothetical protein
VAATDRTSVAISVICIPNDVPTGTQLAGQLARWSRGKNFGEFLLLFQLRRVNVAKKSAIGMNYVSPSVPDC